MADYHTLYRSCHLYRVFAVSVVLKNLCFQISTNLSVCKHSKIVSAFENLEKIADEKGLSKDILSKMKSGWKEQLKEITH
jgi:hypothetical protein